MRFMDRINSQRAPVSAEAAPGPDLDRDRLEQRGLTRRAVLALAAIAAVFPLARGRASERERFWQRARSERVWQAPRVERGWILARDDR